VLRSLTGKNRKKTLIIFFRKCTTSLKSCVPTLASYDALKDQFNWLIDGEITHLVEENLLPEIANMELYLRYRHW
jgi:hypothetical protein